MSKAPEQGCLPGFESAPATIDTGAMLRIEEIAEYFVANIHVARPFEKAKAPIDRDAVACVRPYIERWLREEKLPVPDAAFLDALIVELCWWFEFELADDIPPPEIDVLPEQPGKARAKPVIDDGLGVVGWDPWE